ncbi:DUF6281 family protein [Streptomyces sp. NPDC002917]|uniref:DUF6281 family protein n=1 Tax=unclassified Streptomyces TaxID=2593676 RepID=UPI0036C63226|nr:DUF6281 family protein [Streptomyces sp. NBC_01643]
MSWTGRSAGVLLAAAMVMSVAACTADSGGGGEESASCVARYTYQDRSYRDVANVNFTLGRKLGAATSPPCEDTGGRGKGEEPVTTETAYEVDGISPKVAIAIGDTPKTAMFFAAYSGSELPPEVQKLIDGS